MVQRWKIGNTAWTRGVMMAMSVINQHLQVWNFSKTLLIFVIVFVGKEAQCYDLKKLCFWKNISDSVKSGTTHYWMYTLPLCNIHDDTWRKLNALCTFNLLLVSTGITIKLIVFLPKVSQLLTIVLIKT